MRRSWAVCLLVLAGCVLPADAQQGPAEQGKGAIPTVRGVARIEVKPDYARLRVTVSTKAPTLEEAARAHRDRATRALSTLKDVEGVEIERSTFSLNQDPPLPASEHKLPTPFTAKTEFLLKINAVANLNAVLTKLATSGLFEVFFAQFGAKDERAVLNQARRQAMADARDQAAAYADAADLRLVEIVAITDGEASRFSNNAADLPVTRFVQIIPPLTVAFDSAVQVTWRIAPR